jgi:hypothetical protein
MKATKAVKKKKKASKEEATIRKGYLMSEERKGCDCPCH